MLDAFLEAGLGTATLITADELLQNEITVFQDRVRVDVQTATPGLVFAEAWERRDTMIYQKQPFPVVSLDDLIASKRAAGRAKDLDDIAALTPSENSDEA